MTVADDMRTARAQAVTESRILREQLDRPTPHPPTLTYTVRLTCPQCGGPVQHATTSAAPRSLGVEARAVATCTPCRDTFVITIELAGMKRQQRCLESLDRDTALNPAACRHLEGIAS